MPTHRDPAGGEHGGYGWVPDLPDHRDSVFEPDVEALRKVAEVTSIDLSTDSCMPPIWNQANLGSCTAHSVGAAFAFAHAKAGNPAIMPARLWIYYQERLLEGTVSTDSGAMIRDGFKVCATVGVPPEDDWPYDIATFAQAPSDKATQDAVLHKDVTYASVAQDKDQIKAALIAGFPVSFGFTVYDSFESAEVAQTGLVPMPQPGESVLGGHAVLKVGFDDAKVIPGVAPGAWKVRNSWDETWGDHGHFWMPYAFSLDPNLADDFWQVTVAS